jgi:hypothetical protein
LKAGLAASCGKRISPSFLRSCWIFGAIAGQTGRNTEVRTFGIPTEVRLNIVNGGRDNVFEAAIHFP